MANPLLARLLPFARTLRDAATLHDVLDRANAEIAEALGFRHVWLFVFKNDDEATLLDISSATIGDDIRRSAATLTIRGDAMLEEIAAAEAPVVVVDARTDPRTDKAMVAAIGNRTIVNIPLRLLDAPLGALGLGTFGDEGVRPPTPEEVEYLVGLAGSLSIAVGRIRFLEERAQAEAEKRVLERRIFESQRLESLGVLAGGIAHDFNNLLTIVLASGGLLSEIVTGPATADVDAILGAAERGRGLTRQLLALSQANVLDLRPLNVNERLRDLVVLLRRIMPETLEMDLVPGAALPLIEGDAAELDQVFMNLCINARDAMPKGGRITLETMQVLVNGQYAESHPWAKPGRYVLVTVTDNGVGMPPEVMERIFEPFFSTKAASGTGLGLAVAYGIVRQHGGMLHVYSEPGVGSTFKVYLPAFLQLASQVEVPIAPAVPHGNERILVAEDDANVRAVIARILRNAGYDVETVEHGQAAVERATAELFGLVILDTIMPRMSGPEALEAIRAVRPETRFVLSSGYLGDVKGAVIAAMPQVRFLEKPYDPDRLLRMVRDALDD
jgi:signal transduction histidine kinase/CheY-like chemotaxis protein